MGLIDQARDLPYQATSGEQLLLKKIEDTERSLIDLLLKGTKNPNAVIEILGDLKLPKPTKNIRHAKFKKDWLPYFTEPYSKDLEEFRQYWNKKKR